MPIRLPPGSPATALCRPEECKGCGARVGDRDARTAGLALSPLLCDGMAMAALRAAWLPLLPFAGEPTLSQLDDQQVLDAIGAALASGQLLLCPGFAEAESTDPAADPQAAAAAAAAKATADAKAEGERQALPSGPTPPPPPAPRAAPPPPSAAAAAPPPPTPAPAVEAEIDAAAMTAVLLAAARDGVPFCEECEKARKAREAQAA